MEQKIRELAAKCEIPEALLKDAIKMEREKLVFKDSRRRLMSELEKIIVKYSD